MHVLVTGGAGFIGTNLVAELIGSGHTVTVFDNLSRRGVERNLAWLKTSFPNPSVMRVLVGDVRDLNAVASAAADVDAIYHLAAQVAVTSSVTDPRTDFEVNALGTLNVLEAARAAGTNPFVVFTSTNKVYGGMEDVQIVAREDRYEYGDDLYRAGISELRPLDFHSPYGCSKGAADQYVRDYHRMYGLRTTVFRMSCIYGPHQFGNEDQGWVAHFLIASVLGLPLTIFGDGKQVRDVLYVEDLVRAFTLVAENPDRLAGEIYNVGGGQANTISIWAEFGEMLRELTGKNVQPEWAEWRPGDQLVYVSDVAKIRRDLGWAPEVSARVGVQRLHKWVLENRELIAATLGLARR
jgi:CDP-paratose 2-epimerase